MNSDFTVVKRKKQKKLSKKNLRCLPLHDLEDECYKSLPEVVRIIETAESEINTSPYYISLLLLVDQQIKESDKQKVNEILCYGLGHFSTNVNARYQLGLLLNLVKYFKPIVFIYDPLFNELELQVLKHYNFNVITENEKGKRKIKSEYTFVYLPHCPHWLVNNFLWKNWGVELTNCILFTNSFNEIIENNSTNKLKRKYKYLYKLLVKNSVIEINIENSFKFNDIFNSLALHIFPVSVINNLVNKEPLSDLEEPFHYSDSEEDIVHFSEEFENKINI